MDTNNTQLDDASRTKLDGVVLKMHQNGEPDDNIQAVVNDFKKKYGKAPAVDTSTSTDEPTSKGLLGQLGDRANNIGDIRKQFQEGKINPASGTLQIAGNLAGGVNDIVGAGVGLVNKGLRHIPGVSEVEDAVTGGISKGIEGAASTSVGKGLINKGQEFAKAHPEATKNLGAAGNVLGTATMFSGLGALKEGLVSVLGKDAIKSIASDITPELTSKGTATAIAKGGTTKSLVSGLIKPVVKDSALKDAEIVAEKIPNFTKLKTFSDKVNAVRDAVYGEASKLKDDVIASGKDRIFPIKELASKIAKAEELISLRGTAFEKQIKPLKDAVVQMAQKNGGTISSLFDTTKEFDQLVNKTWPTLWDKDNAPMRQAVKAVRDTINKYIDDNLPEETNFLQRRLHQSKLFNAIDALAPKAVDEIGTTRLQRFAGRHPISSGLLKKGVKYGAEGAMIAAGGGGAYAAYKGLTGN